MATSQMSELVLHLRRAALLHDGAGQTTDGELLAGFIERRDEVALAALVRRHGPMVWGVCRRLLSHHDAEDAFQATFLVLVRKAVSIIPRDRVGNWLYGVAHQTALQARRTAARRRTREVQVMQMPDTEAVQQDHWPDLQPVLDEELSRLPNIYRAVIVLCELEGRTRKEVAHQLGVPEGTVGGRLARARVLLAKRLAHRGIVMSGGALAAVLSASSASASVSPSLVASTIKAASLLAAGRAAGISVEVATLTEGVVKSMFVTKIKSVLAVVLVVGFFCGVVGTMYKSEAAEPPKEGQKDKATERTSTAQKGDTPLPKATPQQGYSITSKLLEAAPDKPKEILVLPKANADDRQLIPIQIKDASPDSLARIGGDDKLKIGTFLDVRVSSLDDKKVRLYYSFQKNEVEKSGDNSICVVGSHVQVIRDIELDKPVKLVLTKDDKGGERRWVETTVSKTSPDTSVESPRKKEDKK
jgi:RNA polymerase sigma factor (sigma-70 family)